jgi:hypothetical protein
MSDPGMAQRLRQRDIDRYGNPEGPTFQNLLDEARGRGLSEEDALRSIIEDASETNSRTNNYLQIDSYSRPMHQMTVQAA